MATLVLVDKAVHIEYHQCIMTRSTKVSCTYCFSTLGVGSRMKIYKFLREKGPKTVTSVVSVVGLTQPTVSYHLKEMKVAGLLTSKKFGKEVYYAVSEKCPVHSKACILSNVEIPAV